MSYPALLETVETGTRQIETINGFSVLIDAGFFQTLSTLRWRAYFDKKGHVSVRTTTRPVILMHRWLLRAPKGVLIDHINAAGGMLPDGRTIDNRRANLRYATSGQNRLNSVANQNNKSGYKNVYWDKQRRKYRAQINPAFYLGMFKTAEEAARAVDQAALQLQDARFVKLNLPPNGRRDLTVQAKIERYLQSRRAS